MTLEAEEGGLEQRDGRRRWFLVEEVVRREAVYLSLLVVKGRPCGRVVVEALMARMEVGRRSGVLLVCGLRYLRLAFLVV